MAKIQVYSVKGKKTGTIDLPKELIAKENTSLLTQAVHVYEDRSHKGTSRVQTRGEVNATTAKMYRQKGTGNARHGSRKAPIFKGGGVAHGPKGIKKVLNLSRNLKDSALRVALNIKIGEGKVVVVDKLETIKKTKEAQDVVKQVAQDLGIKNLVNVKVVLEKSKKDTVRFFRNIKSLSVDYWRKLNAANVYRSNLVIIDKDSLKETKNMHSQENQKTLSKLSAEVQTPKPKSNKKTPAKKIAKTVSKKKTNVKKVQVKGKTQKLKKGTK